MLLATLASSCALTSNSPPLDVRYFSVDVPGATTTTRAADLAASRSATEGGVPSLALGRVRSSEFLRDRIVQQEEDGSRRASEAERWTEYPEAYLRRSLVASLFSDDRFAQSLGRGVPTLDAELLAFEEVRRHDRRAGRVSVEYRLRAGDRILAQDVVTAERDVPLGGGIAPVADALEVALGDVTRVIAAQSAEVLRR
jgi:hypothetical protein